jgi:diguanylate cyclase (GGDEF)-like protein/PAS domain S-box-containing protein
MHSTAKIPQPACSPYEELLEFLYLTPVGIIKFTTNGAIELANPAACQLLMPLVQGKDLANIYTVLRAAAPNLPALIDSYAAPSGEICNQMHVPVPGTRTILSLGINKIRPATYMAVVQDITHAIAQDERIRDDHQRLLAIFDNIRDCAIYTANAAGHLDEWNRSLGHVGGWAPADVTGASVAMFFSSGAEDPEKLYGLLNRARQGGAAEMEGWVFRKDGSAFWGSTVATVLPNHAGRPHGFVFVTRDLTERKRMEDRLVTQATTDPLTGAHNRRAGEASLADAFDQWTRHARGFAVAMVDVDHFKSINDKWGHDAGDAVLVRLTGLLREISRGTDLIVRWGGEEFLLLLPDASGESAGMIAERVRNAVATLQIAQGADVIRITASIGIAAAAPGDTGPDDVVRRADQALYAAKRGGRNRVIAN